MFLFHVTLPKEPRQVHCFLMSLPSFSRIILLRFIKYLIVVTWCLEIVPICYRFAQGAKVSTLSTAVTSKDNTVRINQIPNNSFMVSRECF